jgi:hypothetical protein
MLGGAPVIGYAPSQRKVREHTDAGARALAASMTDIRTVGRAVPPATGHVTGHV